MEALGTAEVPDTSYHIYSNIMQAKKKLQFNFRVILSVATL